MVEIEEIELFVDEIELEVMQVVEINNLESDDVL